MSYVVVCFICQLVQAPASVNLSHVQETMALNRQAGSKFGSEYHSETQMSAPMRPVAGRTNPPWWCKQRHHRTTKKQQAAYNIIVRSIFHRCGWHVLSNFGCSSRPGAHSRQIHPRSGHWIFKWVAPAPYSGAPRGERKLCDVDMRDSCVAAPAPACVSVQKLLFSTLQSLSDAAARTYKYMRTHCWLAHSTMRLTSSSRFMYEPQRWLEASCVRARVNFFCARASHTKRLCLPGKGFFICLALRITGVTNLRNFYALGCFIIRNDGDKVFAQLFSCV